MINNYKDSPLGEIPKEWEVVKLKECAEKITDGSHHSPVPQKKTGYFIATVRDMLEREFSLEKCAHILKEDYELLERNGCKPKIGDVLLSKDGTIGKTFVYSVNQEVVLLSSIAIIRLVKNRLSSDFLSQVLKSHIFYKQLEGLKSGSAIRRLVLRAINEIRIPLPTLFEQKKIAEILSTVDEKIDLIDQQIKATEQLKKGMMQRLLTKGIGHTEFKDSPLGEIPKEWEVVELKDIAEVKGRIGYRGYTKADLVEKGQGALAIGGGQISKKNKLDLSQPVYLSWNKYEESPEIKISKGDIVFAQRGTLGRTALVENLMEAATINPSMVLIKDISCNNTLLYYYLCSRNIQKIVEQISTATAVPMLSQKQIKKFKIALPSIEEQEKIVRVLNCIDNKLDVLFEKKINYLNLKKGLMQQLLTGKIRVNSLIKNEVSA